MQTFLATANWIWVDYVIAVLLGLPALRGLFRGLLKELFAIGSWLLAIVIGLQYNAEVAFLLQNNIANPITRIASAFGILVVITLLFASLINFLLSELIYKSGLGLLNRLFGFCLGFIKGSVLVLILIFLAGLSAIPEDPWWKQSLLIPPFQSLAIWLKEYIPSNLAGYINFR
jgi:membrane protein required for colicin V production